MKKIVCLLVVFVLGISQGVYAQETAQEPTTAAEEISPEQFLKEFVTAMPTKDAAYLRHLLTSNPSTAGKVEQRLTELSKGAGEEAEQSRVLAELLRMVRQTLMKSLQKEGEQAHYASDYQTALKKWQAGLEQAHSLNDKLSISQFLSNIGMMYRHFGQYQQALKYYKQALAIARELGNRYGEGVTLGNIGMVYDYLGQYQQALKCYEQALVIRREIGDRGGEGHNLNNIGGVYTNLG